MAAEVNVYSARKEQLIKPLLDRFTEETGIKVNLVTAKADTLIKRLEIEGRNSPADVLITVDVARLLRTKNEGLFQTLESELLSDTIPAQYRDPENTWFGLSLRSRVIVYSPDRVDVNNLSSYENLVEANWQGRICIRSSSNVYNQSLVASLVANNGEAATAEWAKGMVKNFAREPKGGDRDQIKAVVAGVCDIAVVNTYYLGAMLESDQEDQSNIAKQVKLFWPNQSDRGTHMNVSGAGVLSAAPNKESAIKLVEFLVSDESQAWYAKINHEYPVKSGITISDTLTSWGEFKADPLSLDELGKNNKPAVLLMDRAGWK
ncbi:MAG: Fe(3+) ABC transporter substrate-binding protein [Pseudomonadota bacterium]